MAASTATIILECVSAAVVGQGISHTCSNAASDTSGLVTNLTVIGPTQLWTVGATFTLSIPTTT